MSSFTDNITVELYVVMAATMFTDDSTTKIGSS